MLKLPRTVLGKVKGGKAERAGWLCQGLGLSGHGHCEAAASLGAVGPSRDRTRVPLPLQLRGCLPPPIPRRHGTLQFTHLTEKTQVRSPEPMKWSAQPWVRSSHSPDVCKLLPWAVFGPMLCGEVPPPRECPLLPGLAGKTYKDRKPQGSWHMGFGFISLEQILPGLSPGPFL